MKNKNAIRQHFVAKYTEGQAMPEVGADDWKALAKNITSISDETEDKTDTAGDYAGDGNEVEILTGRSEAWKFEGSYDPEDDAQKLIAGMKRTTTDKERLLWHMIIETNGDVVTGLAKALEIIAGGGDATEYEEISGKLAFTQTPQVTSMPEKVKKTKEK